MEDAIDILSADGKIERKVRLFPLLRPLVSESRLGRVKQRLKGGTPDHLLTREGAPGDVSHCNSIRIVERPIEGIAPAGSVLLSFRELNRIVILDPDLGRILWEWGNGELEGQHHATLLEDGNIMVFDNGVRRKRSRVLEIDPKTRKIVWSYTADNLYTRLRGAAQKLPNGNVLITESDRGHVIEVTPKGDRVWEFWNPDVIGGKTPTRGVIYRMTRYERSYLKRALDGKEAPSAPPRASPEDTPAPIEED